MIFSIANHVEQIKKGTKTQTRRKSGIYQVGKHYSIQPKRTSKGLPDGAILITDKRFETPEDVISVEDAKAEGGYTPTQFEALYLKMYPLWCIRYAYEFKFVKERELKQQ